MKGIILAGGAGTRLDPVTRVISKQMLPIYDKPMIHYPLSILMLAGIREILIISTPRDLPQFRQLLGDGSELNMQLSYAEQPKPNGLPEAFKIGADFIGDDSVTLILGDNIFYGQGLLGPINRAIGDGTGATIFGYRVKDPERFGVIEFDADRKVISLEEKPTVPKSNYAATGLYVYDNTVVKKAFSLQPGKRGETEITDLNRLYMEENKLRAEVFGRGVAWLDTGTHASLLEAGLFIETIEKRQGLKVSCIEEIAFRMGFITADQFEALISSTANPDFKQYLAQILAEAESTKF